MTMMMTTTRGKPAVTARRAASSEAPLAPGELARTIAAWGRRVDRALAGWLARGERPARLTEAISYSLNAGGKRFRPVLAMGAARACGASPLAALPAACALECVHTYSLIHDDLPAMDDDDLRRGKPTSHKVFGEANAILAGDALLTEAFAILAGAGRHADRVRRGLVAELAAAAGGSGMVGGQVLDMEAEGKPPEAGSVRRIHRLKTGALITAAARMGGISAGATRGVLARLTRFGAALGEAFQIVDDLLDEQGTAAELGKRPGADRAHAKATWPAAVGVEAARRDARRLADEARGALAGFGARAALLRGLVDYVVERRS
jgi:geranylgeranyl diphosphate synthase type II